MDTFDKWFSRFLWGTDLVFLAASTPHIAAWYEHFDHASTPIEAAYAWGVGYGLAIAIDGVSVMLLYALIRIIKRGEKGWGTKAGLLLFMAFISGLSWLINWQYDLQFASAAFSKADAVTLGAFGSQVNMGSLNPALGGAFSVLLMAYALIGKVIRPEEAKPALTDEEHKEQLKRIAQKKELQDAMRGKGFIGGLVDNVSTLADGVKMVGEKFDKTDAPNTPVNTDSPVQNAPGIEDQMEAKTEESTPSTAPTPHQEEEGKTQSKAPTSGKATSGTSMTVKEAAAHLGLSESMVRKLRDTHKIHTTTRNKRLLTKSSVEAYQKTRDAGTPSTPNTDPIPVLKSESNGHTKEPIQADQLEQLVV